MQETMYFRTRERVPIPLFNGRPAWLPNEPHLLQDLDVTLIYRAVLIAFSVLLIISLLFHQWRIRKGNNKDENYEDIDRAQKMVIDLTLCDNCLRRLETQLKRHTCLDDQGPDDLDGESGSCYSCEHESRSCCSSERSADYDSCGPADYHSCGSADSHSCGPADYHSCGSADYHSCGLADCTGDLPSAGSHISRGHSPTSYLTAPTVSDGVGVASCTDKGQSSKGRSEADVSQSLEGQWKRDLAVRLHRRRFREKWEGFYRGSTTSTSDPTMTRAAVTATSDAAAPITAPPRNAPSVRPTLSTTKTSTGDRPSTHPSTPMASSGVAGKGQSETNVPQSPEAGWKQGPELSLGRKFVGEKLEGVYRGVTAGEPDVSQSLNDQWKRDLAGRLHQKRFREKWEGFYRGSTTSTSDPTMTRAAVTSDAAAPITAPPRNAPSVRPTLSTTKTSTGDRPSTHPSTPMASSGVAGKGQSKTNVPQSPEAGWKQGPELSLGRNFVGEKLEGVYRGVTAGEPDVSQSLDDQWKRDLAGLLHQKRFRKKWEGFYRGSTTSTSDLTMTRAAVTSDAAAPITAPPRNAPSVRPTLSTTKTSTGDRPSTHPSTPMASSGVAGKGQSETNVPQSPEAGWKQGPELSLGRKFVGEKLEGVYRGVTAGEPDVSQSLDDQWKRDLAVRLHRKRIREKWEGVIQGSTTSTLDSRMTTAAVTATSVTAPSGAVSNDTAPSGRPPLSLSRRLFRETLEGVHRGATASTSAPLLNRQADLTAPPVRPPLFRTRTSGGDRPASHLSTPMVSSSLGDSLSAHKGQSPKGRFEPDVSVSHEGHWKQGLHRRHFDEGSTASTSDSLRRRAIVTAQSDTALPHNAPSVRPTLSMTKTSTGDRPATHPSSPMASSGVAVKGLSETNVPQSSEAGGMRGPQLSLSQRLIREKLIGIWRSDDSKKQAPLLPTRLPLSDQHSSGPVVETAPLTHPCGV